MVNSNMNRLINFENREETLSILNEAEHIYTTIQKTGVSKKCFWRKSLMFTKAAFIW